jgi:hypothetical protein
MDITISQVEINTLMKDLQYRKHVLGQRVFEITVDTPGSLIRDILGSVLLGRLSAQIKQALIQGAI